MRSSVRLHMATQIPFGAHITAACTGKRGLRCTNGGAITSTNFVIEKPLAEQPELLGRRLTMPSFRFRPKPSRSAQILVFLKPVTR